MMKLTRKDVAIAKQVDSLKLGLGSFNGSPVISIKSPDLGGLVGILFIDEKDSVVVGESFLRIDDDGRLIVKVMWKKEFDEDEEPVNFYEEVDVTELVTVRVGMDDPCLESFRGALEHPEWREFYMSKRAFKFLNNVITIRKEEEVEE